MPARIATTTINVTIVDGNDNIPQFIGVPYTFSIPETSSSVRTLVVTLNATDLDTGAAGSVQFQLAGGITELFDVNESTVRLHNVYAEGSAPGARAPPPPLLISE